MFIIDKYIYLYDFALNQLTQTLSNCLPSNDCPFNVFSTTYSNFLGSCLNNSAALASRGFQVS